MKGETSLKFLEYIGDAAMDVADLTTAFLSAGYGASQDKINNEFARRSNKRLIKNNKNLEIKRQRQRFYTVLYRMRKDGLIQEDMRAGTSNIILTSKGKQRLEYLKKIRNETLPKSKYNTFRSENGKFTIAVFDVPENHRKKRAWLRLALGNLGFQCIQKSVWVGKVKVPKEFLEDLQSLHLIEYVELFEISKTGSLQQLT